MFRYEMSQFRHFRGLDIRLREWAFRYESLGILVVLIY